MTGLPAPVASAESGRWQRRARPALGTLVEIGVPNDVAAATIDAAFDAVAEVERALSRFDPRADIARFNALGAGASLAVGPHTVEVLEMAAQLQRESHGLFDVTLGSGADAWSLTDEGLLHKHDARVRIDLGGIGKGHAIDVACTSLIHGGCAGGWVNAGGDLRAFGTAELPLQLRDERHGGTVTFGRLAEGALATSHFAADSRAGFAAGAASPLHCSVAAPLALLADALTKVVACAARADHPLLARHGAHAFIHRAH